MNMKEFYDYHLELLKKGDVNELVEHDYHEEAVMLLLAQEEPVVIKGRNALKGQLGYYVENIYRGLISTDKFVENEDSMFFEATINTAFGPSKVYDALYMKDGQIYRHYSGAK